MKTSRTKILSVGLLVGVIVISTSPAFAQGVEQRSKQTVKNVFGEDATDLELKFKFGPVRNVKYLRPNKDGGVDEVTPNSQGADFAIFSASTLSDTIPGTGAGNSRNIVYDAQKDAAGNLGTIDKASPNTFWTQNGVRLVDSLAMIGVPPVVGFDGLAAFATFINPEAFSVIYSDIQMFRDNDLAKLDSALFDVPTGTLVTGVPTLITLLAGESLTLPFGAIDPSKYVLVLADAFAIASPDDRFAVASAAAVPEPSTLLLVGVSLAALHGIAWRRPGR